MAHTLCEHEDGCTRIRIAAGTANALTTAVIRDLARAMDEADRASRGVMLCGGEKFFCNGLDLDWALAESRAGIREMFVALAELILAMLESPRPIVGVVKGHAVGGGMALYLACDYRYGAAGRVLIGKPEVLLGVPNPYYGDQLLRFVAGDFVASDLIYSGRLVRGRGGAGPGARARDRAESRDRGDGLAAAARALRPRARRVRGIEAHAARQVLRRPAGAAARPDRAPGGDLARRGGTVTAARGGRETQAAPRKNDRLVSRSLRPKAPIQSIPNWT